MTGSPKRVLVCPELFWPNVGGIEVLLGRLLPELAERGHTFLVLTSSDGDAALPERDEYRGIPIERLPLRDVLRSGAADDVLRLRGRVKKVADAFRPDVVHAHGVGYSSLFQLAARRAGTPFVVTLHQDLRVTPIAPDSLGGHLLAMADVVTAVSPSLATQARQLAPAVSEKLIEITNGGSVPNVTPSTLPFAPARLVCAGRLVKEKGFDIGVAAMGLLAPKHHGLRLVIAGAGDRGPLESQIRALGLSHVVELVGLVAGRDMHDLLNSATLVLSPSRQEGFGLVALEAAHVQRPVVASRIMGLTDIVADGETGLLVTPEDPAALAAAIDSLLTNPDRAIAMGVAARKRAVEKFSWQACVDGYDRLYRTFPGNTAE